jgi:hypothetical protein
MAWKFNRDMQDIEVHIGELVLHGFARNDYEGIRKAVEAELLRLISANGIPESIITQQSYRRVEGVDFNIHNSKNAAHIGSEIAVSVYNGLKNLKGPLKK